MHRIDGAARIGRDGGKERGRCDTEANLLALHVSSRLRSALGGIDAERSERGIPVRLRPVDRYDTDGQQGAHDCEERPALPFVFDHAA